MAISSGECPTECVTDSGECPTECETGSGKCPTECETSSGKCPTKHGIGSGECTSDEWKLWWSCSPGNFFLSLIGLIVQSSLEI